jgi:hypothetical protein
MATSAWSAPTASRADPSCSMIAALQAGVSLWTIFKQDPELFRRKDTADIATRLVIAGSHDSRSALVTPPIQPFADWRNAANAALHARPRLDVISTLGKMAPAPQAHGGLSPAAMRRVREYVDAHLGGSMDLARWPVSRESRSTISREDSSNPPA